MQKIIYKCDLCKKEISFELSSDIHIALSNSFRHRRSELNFNLCDNCLTSLIKYSKTLISQKSK